MYTRLFLDVTLEKNNKTKIIEKKFIDNKEISEEELKEFNCKNSFPLGFNLEDSNLSSDSKYYYLKTNYEKKDRELNIFSFIRELNSSIISGTCEIFKEECDFDLLFCSKYSDGKREVEYYISEPYEEYRRIEEKDMKHSEVQFFINLTK